jgi:integrase/antitoxin (DNA-binding transcriptional repressor) of toxin-antitoxin stability system
VPQALRATIGQTEIKVSLRTKDAKEAKRLAPIEASKVDQRLALAANGSATLTHQQLVALAGDGYRRRLAEDEGSPGDPDGLDDLLDEWRRPGRTEKAEARKIADGLLREAGVAADALSLDRLTEQVIEHQQRLLWTLGKRAEGDYTPDSYVAGLPRFEAQPKAVVVSLAGLFKLWVAERKPPEKTEYSWQRIYDRMAASVGHDDAGRVSKSDMVKWKDALVAAKLAPKTINNQLAVVHTVFEWATKNDKITRNPAKDVGVLERKVAGKRRLPYSDDQAAKLLRGARKLSGFKRWVPWLLAYTGARMDEVCQALVSDVLE